MACTTLLVGKKASYDGSTLISRTEDSPSGEFTAKRFIVVKADPNPGTYQSTISKEKVELPENALRYTALPNSDPVEGIWAAAGVNEKNVGMTATETITTNARVQGADPLLPASDKKQGCGGLGEEDFVTLVLPYIHSAREGVIRLGQLLAEHGTYEANGVAFQDDDEIWWLETIGGHHWVARKVPDDCYVVMPNQLGIDYFDFVDAYGKQENFMCSPDLEEWTEKYHLALDVEGDFNPRLAYGSHAPSDHVYNTPRAWYMLNYFSPKAVEEGGYTPESDDLPWCFQADRKITVEDMKAVLSSHYEGTGYDCYAKHADPLTKGMYRPIGISRNNISHITQIRGYMPAAIRSLQWLSYGCNAFNAAVAFYANIEKSPAYFANPSTKPTTESFYWTNRLVAGLCDAHFQKTGIHVERYQDTVQAKCHEIINRYDEKYLTEQSTDSKGTAIETCCETANQEIADFVQKKTIDLLDKVLYVASCEMKNGFARSDN